MTDDEVERSIEFVLKNQATLEIQLERTSRQIEETNRRLEETDQRLNQRIEETNQRLEMHAETQREFIQVVTRHIEAQGEINTSLRGAVRELSVSMQGAVRELTAAQMRTDARLDKTDARLDRLTEIVERFITEGRNGKS